MKRPRGFTLVELLVVVGIIAMLVGILMPTLGRALEIARVASCAANLNAVGKGIKMHSSEFDGKFPLLFDEGDTDADVTATTDSDEVDGATLGANAMQNVWVMIKKGTILENHFKCPSDKMWKTRKEIDSTDLKTYGWVSWYNFSYGMHKPYSDPGGSNKASLTMSKRGDFIIFADKNFGADETSGCVYRTSDLLCRKPANHPADGFNYLSFGASVQKGRYDDTDTSGTSQSTVGISGDDVFLAGDDDGETISTAAVTGTPDPTDDTDTFILPWKKDP